MIDSTLKTISGRHLLVIFALASFAGCSAGEQLPPGVVDLRFVAADQYVSHDINWPPKRDAGIGDAFIPPKYDAAPKFDTGCQVGTPQACASCTDKCPGPTASKSTERVCIGAKCDIQCKDEYYDVNGAPTDGCEFVDDLPIHDVESAAASMGSFSDCKGKQTTSAVMPSDARLHINAPTNRANGRADFFKLTISDDWGCNVDADVEVNFGGLPTGSRFAVTAYYRCKDGTKKASKSSAASGGSSIKITPSIGCSTGGFGDDSGTVFIEVKKQSGPHNNGNYQVMVTP